MANLFFNLTIAIGILDMLYIIMPDGNSHLLPYMYALVWHRKLSSHKLAYA